MQCKYHAHFTSSTVRDIDIKKKELLPLSGKFELLRVRVTKREIVVNV